MTSGTPSPGPDAQGSELVYEWDGPPRLELWRGQVTLPSGLNYTGHALRTGAGRGGVVVIARRGQDVLLVRSWRPSVGADLWELPRGFGESDALGDALRELAEESGFEASHPRELGSYVTDSSVLPSHVSVVECRVDPAVQPHAVDGETEERRWVSPVELAALIADGTVHDAHTLAALMIAQAARD